MKYDINGNELTIINGEYSGVPERCNECNCAQSEPNRKDYSNKSIHLCEQCGTEFKIYDQEAA